MVNKKILIADDVKNIQLFGTICKGEGYKVVGVESGEKALKYIDKMLPDIVLLNTTISGIDGFEVCRRLKSNHLTKDIPVIFISSLTDASDKVKAFKAGGVDYITKPFNSSELFSRVETHLTLRTLQQNLQKKNIRLEQEISELKQTVIGTDENIITRSIEFPPEYHQAGISILNYFSTVLRKKYPDAKAKVRIEQEDLKVTMTIDPVEGDREIIEKALDEYGLVVTGKMLPDEYTDDRLLKIELESKLTQARAEIETQKLLLQYRDEQIREKDERVREKDTQIKEFMEMVKVALARPQIIQQTQKQDQADTMTKAENHSFIEGVKQIRTA